MAITYDAPSTNWETATRTSNEPRISYPIPQNESAIFYEQDFVQNQCDYTFTPPATPAVDTRMASTRLDGSISSSTTTIDVDSTDGFPCYGTLWVDNTKLVPYTGRTATSFTGCTVVGSYADRSYAVTAARLVEESTPSVLGGTLVQFTRKFATVPDDWNDYKEATFQFPGYYNDPYEANFRCPQNLNATIKSTLTYLLTTNPYTDPDAANILDVANQMFRVVDADLCVLDYVDTTTVPTYATYTGYVSAKTLIYSAQSSLQRYAGNIWCRTEFQTKAQ